MKLFAFLATLALAAGCHGQQPVTPVTYSCPAAGNAAYTTLNAAGSSNPPTTALTYTVSGVTQQTCYIAQGYLPASGGTAAQTGSWSNTAGPAIGGATGKVALSVTCTAGTGTTCAGVEWEFSYAAAVSALAPAVPSMGNPTTSELTKPKCCPKPRPRVKDETAQNVQLKAASY